MIKPCLRCTRVRDPLECDNKNCRPWRQWFTERWDQLRREPRLRREAMERQPEGMVIGGQRYALPHRVHSYLDHDPCEGCLCPRDLCVIPCRIKRDWVTARELTQ